MSAIHKSQSIASLVSESSNTKTLYQIGLVVFGIVLLTVSAKIQVPFWPVPMTLQTLAVMGIAAAYGSRLGVATIVAYLAAGFAGAPVFAGAVAGPAYFVGPTAGFLAGFVVIAAIVGAAADRGWANNPAKLFGTMLFADIICFALGFTWLAYMFVSPSSGATLGSATAYGIVSQYFLADLVKIALAALTVPAIAKAVTR
jgi:biotin transport system substrate-specific component